MGDIIGVEAGETIGVITGDICLCVEDGEDPGESIGSIVADGSGTSTASLKI